MLLSMIVAAGYAQHETLPSTKSLPKQEKVLWRPGIQFPSSNFADTSVDQQRKVLDAYNSFMGTVYLTPSHKTSKGAIYTTPIDNMPCLVPDMSRTAPMPGAVRRNFPESRMPNAYPQKWVVPQQAQQPTKRVRASLPNVFPPQD